jgi:hypothetical protein
VKPVVKLKKITPTVQIFYRCVDEGKGRIYKQSPRYMQKKIGKDVQKNGELANAITNG